MTQSHLLIKSLTLILLFTVALGAGCSNTSQNTVTPTNIVEKFDGQRAYLDVMTQVKMGPRTPSSEAHTQVIKWIASELEKSAWGYEIQASEKLGHPIQNILAKRGNAGPIILIGAHYDSRFISDQDPDFSLRKEPVPGANDGASGVAVLLEMARTLPDDPNKQIWLLFIDAEDQGEIPGWNWILGSRAFAESLSIKPEAVVIIDMIGDSDLNIYKEKNSDEKLTQAIWAAAHSLGYQQHFISEYKYSVLDDHIPFKEIGIPAVDIIDFDYPYWHTTQDTPDKVSAASLQIIGETLTEWLTQY